MAYSVSTITNYLRSLVEGDMLLKNVSVEGEISNLKVHTSGHVYFRLKENENVLAGVMFRSNAASLNFNPKDGDKVIVQGNITVYGGNSSYQVVARKMEMAGQGDLYKKFLELKEKLEDMGMFDEQYKRDIPTYIKTLGIVTSPTGAAVRDIINITKRRNPFVQIILAPAIVQGEGSPESVAYGIKALDMLGVDVIIAGRGGGSIEDLWAFNEEIVAQAIFNCNTPVISAVGHETDTTIADYVADLRAPTPSAAAELAVYDVYELIDDLQGLRDELLFKINHSIDRRREKLIWLERQLDVLSPAKSIAMKKERAEVIQKALNSSMLRLIEKTRDRLKADAGRLHGLSPVIRLSQGYSYTTDTKGNNIESIKKIKAGDNIDIRVSDGMIEAEVKNVHN